MSTFSRTVAPSAEPVTLDEFKAHARITLPFEDALLETYITEAREYCEEYLGMGFVTQTWQFGVDRWPSATRYNPYAALPLPRGPVQNVTSVKYVATANTTYATLASSDYQADTGTGRIFPLDNDTWPTTIDKPNAVLVTYSVGYGGASAATTTSVAAVPQRVKQAILFYTAWKVRTRDINEPVPQVVHSLLDMVGKPYRTWTPDEEL